MNHMRGKMVCIYTLFLLSAVTATQPAAETSKTATAPPQTTVPESTVLNSTAASTTSSPHFVLLQQQQVRKSARNFQPSSSTSSSSTSSTYPYDTAKKKISYSPPDYHLSSISGNLYGGNHAFLYNTYNDKGKHSHYSPPTVTPVDNNNKQVKQSAKYSVVTGGGLPTTGKIDRSQDDRENIMQDYYSQNGGGGSGIREMPLVSPNSRHGYGHYDEHGDYGAVAEDDEYDGGHHYSHELYSPHHHHGHHHHHPVHHYPPPPVYYPAHHHDKHEQYSKLGILAVVKIVLAKLKALGLFKFILILLAKIPLIFLKIAIKFFFLFKAVKLFKLLTISALAPLALIPLIPLLLLPLLLLPLVPLLLPLLAIPLLIPLLLLFLPIFPVLGPPPGGRGPEKKTTSSRRRREASEHVDPSTGRVWRQMDASHDFLILTRRVLESQQCLERIGCKLAATQDSVTYTNVILWLLEKFRSLAPSRIRDRLGSYIEAYKAGAKRPKACLDKFTCDKPKFMMAQGDTYYNLL